MLELIDYSKTYGTHEVIRIQEQTFEKGIHLIQGANGSGKTTLFKSIAGIIKFNGDCVLNKISLKKHPVKYRRHVNYCEAEPKFPDFLSGKELISFVAKTKGDKENGYNNLVNSFGVDGFWESPISTYSSGMLKKISLITAFCGKPALIMLDEPFTTIDQDSSNLLCTLIHEFYLQGCSFIISAHQIRDTIALNFNQIYKVENKQLQKV